jgi:hypothetical protein
LVYSFSGVSNLELIISIIKKNKQPYDLISYNESLGGNKKVTNTVLLSLLLLLCERYATLLLS